MTIKIEFILKLKKTETNLCHFSFFVLNYNYVINYSPHRKKYTIQNLIVNTEIKFQNTIFFFNNKSNIFFYSLFLNIINYEIL